MIRKKAISVVTKVKYFVLNLSDNPAFKHQVKLMFTGQVTALRTVDLTVIRA